MNDALKILCLVVIIIINQFVLMIDYNEMDAMPFGYALFNSNWLTNDWYLSLQILYRLPFGYVSGFFVHLFGFIPTLFVGRIISYIFFSFAYLTLLKVARTNFILGCVGLMMFLLLFPKGMYAGEWIIGGLETKVFAYSFALMSLTSLLRKNLAYAFLYSGISLSFHLLIGGYHLICLASILVYQTVNYNSTWKEVLQKCYPFFIGGAWGLVGIFSYLFDQTTQEISKYGWDIYVQIRVPFHVLPKLNFNALLFPFLLLVIFETCSENLKDDSIPSLIKSKLTGTAG